MLETEQAQRLLASRIPVRFAFSWSDGTPRLIPTWFHCALAGIGGATSFAGATLTSQDLMEFAASLAAGLGIQIEDA